MYGLTIHSLDTTSRPPARGRYCQYTRQKALPVVAAPACHEWSMLACTGSACFIARLALASRMWMAAKTSVDLPGPETLDGYARSADGLQF